MYNSVEGIAVLRSVFLIVLDSLNSDITARFCRHLSGLIILIKKVTEPDSHGWMFLTIGTGYRMPCILHTK
jgi:hypothetical protein